MPETIDEAQYNDEVESQVEHLAEAVREELGAGNYSDPNRAAVDIVDDVLDAHDWFFKSQYGAAAHGCIIEHSDTDPTRFSDWASLAESDEPGTTIQRIAYCCFEADVLDATNERLAAEA